MIKKLKNFFAWDGGFVKGLELLLDLTIILFGFGIAAYAMNELNGKSSIFDALMEILRLIDEQLNKEVRFPLEKIVVLFSISFATVMYLFTGFIMIRVYETTLLKRRFINSMFATFIAMMITNVIFVVVVFVFPLSFPYISGTVFLLAILIQMVMFMLIKYPMWLILKRKLRNKTIVIAPKAEATNIVTKVISDKNTRDRLRYIYTLDNEFISDELKELIDECKTVYISSELATSVKNKIISYSIGDRSKQVKLVPKTYEISLFRAETKNIDDKLMFNLKPLELSLEQRFLKRSFDIIVSGIGLILSFPFLILAWVLIKLDDGGPIFYSQERITINNKPFKIYKVRSMSVDAEKKSGAMLSTKGDARITKVGKFIRATRIDEIPQLWNIFKGEMSFVGPRPERQVFIDQIKQKYPDFEYRVNVKAGLAGYAQYAGKYSTTFEDKLKLDLLYIRNQSFLFDLKILFATVLTVLDRDAATGLASNSSLDDVLATRNYVAKSYNENILKIVKKD